MPESSAGNGGNSSSRHEADDKRALEHARSVLARLKSRLQERRNDQSKRALMVPPIVAA